MSSRSIMSDTESRIDSFRSALQSEFPLHFDDPESVNAPATAAAEGPSPVVLSNRFVRDEVAAKVPVPVPVVLSNRLDEVAARLTKVGSSGYGRREKGLSPVVLSNRFVRDEVEAKGSAPAVVSNRLDEVAARVTKVGSSGGMERGCGGRRDGSVGGEITSRAAVAETVRRSRAEAMVKRVELGFRLCEVMLCLTSFSVMISDKTQGWSGDSFYRYKEYRYCAAVTLIGLVYSGFQASHLAFNLVTGKRLVFHRLRSHFDFAMDQTVSYLLISASSSAATRVDDWVSNWGKDEFAEMASASVGMSFLAFAAFALSSLISGYNLSNRTAA